MNKDIEDKDLLLEVKNLEKSFPVKSGFWQRQSGLVRAVNDVSFSLNNKDTIGIVGESGCGKTTTGRTILRMIEPTSGKIFFKDEKLGMIDISKLDKKQLKAVRRSMQMIFQDPYSSLDSRMTVRQIVGEPLIVQKLAKGQEVEDRVVNMLKTVGLRPEQMNRYPHGFSGGQRQRIGIARSLMTNPRLIVCDEPVSALDVSIQAQILNLLTKLQEELGLSYLFISHDLSVVEHFCARVAVMYAGKIVEQSSTDELFVNPLHPYTEALLSAVPQPNPRTRTEAIILEGEVPSLLNLPTGCFFHPRCKYKCSVCSIEQPELEEVSPGHFVRCHFAKKLKLRGKY
jgi:peptide/nickel transport system ATP-binding protein